jgi:hypothetical protein
LQTGDPNANKLTNNSQAAVPELASGLLWTVNEGGITNVNISQLHERCAFWKQKGSRIPA